MKSPVFFRTPFGDRFSSHAEAIEEYLQQYLSTNQPNLRKQALREMSLHLVHPKLLIDSPLLTDSHPLRVQAIVVSDAFEAVTNGMDNQGVLEALETIEKDSIFYDWKHLILAIFFFYENLNEAVVSHIRSIDAQTPAGKLAHVLEKLLDPARLQIAQLPSSVISFAESLFEADPRWAETIDQLSDALETPLEESFWESLEQLTRMLIEVAPEQARPLVLWAWNQMAWQNFDEKRLLKMTKHIWGDAEAYRLAALGSLGYDPEGSLLLWGRFVLETMSSTDALTARTEAAWEALYDFASAAKDFQSEQGIAEGWDEDWSSFAKAFNAEVKLWPRFRYELPTDWKKMKSAERSANEVPKPRTIKQESSRVDHGQLDLFAS